MTDRYQRMFASLKRDGTAAFIPFTVIGDPNIELSERIIETMIDSGADALELGIPFSDPVADGPTIQAADVRALNAGVRPSDAIALIARVRSRHAEIPIGLLLYANLIECNGRDRFYRQLATAGVDSTVIADVPSLEVQPFAEASQAVGIHTVMIAASNSSKRALESIAAFSSGYTYVVTRCGVTGAETQAQFDRQLLARLASAGAPPAVFGFGISTPAHVEAAIAAGAAGAISGSATVKQHENIADNVPATLARLATFVRQMKTATRR